MNADYGIAMAKMGRPEAIHIFSPFTMDHLAWATPSLRTTSSNIATDGCHYCATVDFHRAQYQALLGTLPTEYARQIERKFSGPFRNPIEVAFPTPVRVGIKAKLGDLIESHGEKFIPFVAVEVFKCQDAWGDEV